MKRTPPLPEPGTFCTDATVERIALVPYGSTHLRIGIFPDVSGS